MVELRICWVLGFWRVTLVPHFVLQELQQVADAPRSKARAGTARTGDSQSIKEAYPDRILINPTDYEDIPR